MTSTLNQYDISVVRPAISKSDIAFRGRALTPTERKNVKKALQTLHSLEIMATNTYRFQITGKENELNKELITAMCNEQTHTSDFLVRLYEYGFKPSLFRWAWWIVGLVFGTSSRLLGPKAIFKIGVWVETKAVHHYSQLLQAAPWDEATRKTIEKDQADEVGHIQTWKKMLAKFA